MDEFLIKKFQKLNEVAYPPELHDRIMRGVILARFSKAFRTILLIVLIDTAIVGSFFFLRLSNNDGPTLIAFMLREFEISRIYFWQLLSVVYEVIPLGLSLALLINIILVIYIARIYSLFKKGAGRSFLKQSV